MENGLTLYQWYIIAAKYALSLDYCLSDDPKDYESYYDDGYSPEEAVKEEISYLE